MKTVKNCLRGWYAQATHQLFGEDTDQGVELKIIQFY